MVSTDILLDLIDRSNLTLIGYTFKDEKIKDALISKINPILIGRVKASFDVQQHLRNLKIEEVLSNSSFYNNRYLLIDINDIDVNDKDLGRVKEIKNLIHNLREQCIQYGYKVIITSALYQTMSNSTKMHDFSGGNTAMYASDLIIKFESGNLKIIKNRYGNVFDIPSGNLKKLLYI